MIHRQHGWVEKKTPIEPGTDGRWGQVMRGDGMSASPCSRHGLTHANLMPTKKEAEAPQCSLKNEYVYIEGCCRFSRSISWALTDTHLSLHSLVQKK